MAEARLDVAQVGEGRAQGTFEPGPVVVDDQVAVRLPVDAADADAAQETLEEEQVEEDQDLGGRRTEPVAEGGLDPRSGRLVLDAVELVEDLEAEAGLGDVGVGNVGADPGLEVDRLLPRLELVGRLPAEAGDGD